MPHNLQLDKDAPSLNTFSGLQLDFLNPKPEDILKADIIQSLSHLCRWGGHTDIFYSVAEHSILLAEYFMSHGKLELARLALLHDASEAYFGDMPTPIKRLLPDYMAMENKMQALVTDRFNLKGDFKDMKEEDTRICRNESIAFFGDRVEYTKRYDPLPFVFPLGLHPMEAQAKFYAIWKELGIDD